jgi:energy-coupling factor transport system substrate-specific component
MAKKDIAVADTNSKKLRTKELIYAGAFGALYIVLMLVIVFGTSMIPILYLLAPVTVGLVCGTVYMLCVLKVKKFGAALILGVLFALCACSNAWFSFVGAIAAALLAELMIKLGNYKSKKMYLLSFAAFNLNMSCPYMMLSFARDSFLKRAVEYYGQEYADGIAKIAPTWIYFPILGFAFVGGILGALLANALIKKHFEKAGVI